MGSRTRRILQLATNALSQDKNDTSSIGGLKNANQTQDSLLSASQNSETNCEQQEPSTQIPSTSKTNYDNEDFPIHYSEDEDLSKSDPYQTDEDSNYSDSHHGGSNSSSSDSCEDLLNNQTTGQDENISSRNNNYLTNISENNKGGKPKKRVRDESKWKRNVIKRLRSTGQEYLNWKSKKIPKRIMKEACVNCRLKCLSKIPEDERKDIFKEYWSLGDISRQRDYISRFVDFNKKQRTRRPPSRVNQEDTSAKSRRGLTFVYHLPQKTNGSTEKIKVCQRFFLNTLSISHQIVKTVCKKTSETALPIADNRGRSGYRAESDDKNNSVREHINSFPLIDSHYCRKSSTRKYLETSLHSVNKMYDLYKSWCHQRNVACASIYSYRYIFNHEYNLSFFRPKKDQCDFCLKYKNSTGLEKERLQADFDKHMENKTLSRARKTNDKERASKSANFCAAVYDLQQVLPCPKSEASQCYYKRKLAVYNLTIYELGNLQGHCYMWHEATSSRGCCEIGCCVLKFIQSKVESGVEEFSFYSDNCGGQNHNRFIYCLYMYCSSKYNIRITHNFLEKGHTQNEGDSVHSTIERASRHVEVYVPEQWYTIARMACKKHTYKVVEMSQQDFFDLKKLLTETTKNWDRDTIGNKVLWQKVKSVYTSPEYPYKIQLKYHYAEEYLTIDTKEKCRKKITEFQDHHLEQLRDDTVAIPKLKHENLMYLCEQRVIPLEYHNFFKNLKTSCIERATAADEEDQSEDED